MGSIWSDFRRGGRLHFAALMAELLFFLGDRKTCCCVDFGMNLFRSGRQRAMIGILAIIENHPRHPLMGKLYRLQRRHIRPGSSPRSRNLGKLRPHPILAQPAAFPHDRAA